MGEAGSLLMLKYSIAFAVALAVAFVGAAVVVNMKHKILVSFASTHLGMLLILSALSHFAQRAGHVEAPFSLFENLAGIFAQVRTGACGGFDDRNAGQEKGHVARSCGCDGQCRGEIAAWLLSSWLVLLGNAWWRRRRKRKQRKRAEGEKE